MISFHLNKYMLERLLEFIQKRQIGEHQKQLNELGIGVLPIRKQIDKVTNNRLRNNWIKHLPLEITQIVPPMNCQNPDSNGKYTFYPDCEVYALGKNGIMDFLPDWFPEVETPIQGDIVLYSKRAIDESEIAEHVGVYQQDGSVKSRWGGGGSVFKHPIHFVPTNYGDIVRFFRISKEQINEIQTEPAIHSLSA